MRWPTALDLFAGAGGLTLGLREARYRVIGAVESDPHVADSYRANFPRIRMWAEDIRDLDPLRMMEDLGIRPGDLGLLAGCPPCQGFSTVRTRRRTTVRDSRNSLVLDYLRFAQAFRPRAVLLENVPGVANYGRFRQMVAGLASCGYNLEYSVFDAARFGVPQRRRRLLLVGALAGLPSLPDPDEASVTVRDVIGHLPKAGESGDALHDIPETRSPKVASIIRRIPKDGGSRVDLGDDQLPCHKDFDGFRDVYGRMAWDRVAPTITGGCVNPSKGRFLHPEEDRTITLREALLLQGFPPGYRLSLERGKFHAAQMVGNAIPPPMARWHAAAVRPLALPR